MFEELLYGVVLGSLFVVGAVTLAGVPPLAPPTGRRTGSPRPEPASGGPGILGRLLECFRRLFP